MKKVLILSMLLMLVSCGKKDTTDEARTINERDLSIVCLDGVKYWVGVVYWSPSYQGFGMLSPKIDKDTKEVETCDL